MLGRSGWTNRSVHVYQWLGRILWCPLCLSTGDTPVSQQDSEYSIQRVRTLQTKCHFLRKFRHGLHRKLPFSSKWPHFHFIEYAPYLQWCYTCIGELKADSRFAPSQWETSLQSNGVSHWLGANLESALRTSLLKSPFAKRYYLT